MQIGKNYKIEAEPKNILLYKRHLNKIQVSPHIETWGVVGYYSSVENALHDLADMKLRESDLKDIKEVVKKQKDIYELIQSISPKALQRA